jgi:hypothetical protein
MLQIEKQLSQKNYFSNMKFDATIDSNYNYFICEGEIRKRNDFNRIIVGGRCISRRKIRVLKDIDQIQMTFLLKKRINLNLESGT